MIKQILSRCGQPGNRGNPDNGTPANTRPPGSGSRRQAGLHARTLLPVGSGGPGARSRLTNRVPAASLLPQAEVLHQLRVLAVVGAHLRLELVRTGDSDVHA